MALKLQDPALRTAVDQLFRAQAKSSRARVGAEQAQALLDKLSDGGRITESEAKDIERLLASSLRLSPKARDVLSKAAAQVPRELMVTAMGRSGFEGRARAGDTIEAVNLTTAPAGRIFTDEATRIGKAKADGLFTGAKLDGVKEGDVVRMRAVHRDGTSTDWLNVKVHGVAPTDTREAAVALDRIALESTGRGKISVTNLNTSRQISEPGAVLQFRNLRTGQKTQVTLDEVGSFDDGVTLRGRKGDTFAVAVTDGVHNVGLRQELAARVVVPEGSGRRVDLLADPAPFREERNKDGTPKFALHRFTGPVIRDGVSPKDVQQGWLDDCYFPAAMAAIAACQPEAIKRMFQDNHDGTYTVTFQDHGPVTIDVDADLYVRPSGSPLYARSDEPHPGAKTMELWLSLAEKAYAAWYGSYDAIGQGGGSDEVFTAVLGKPGVVEGIKGRVDEAWQTLTQAVDSRRPVVLTTFDESHEKLYADTGIYSDHAYSVLGYREVNGRKLVTLRNPWGESEPKGNGVNDGIFELELEQFAKLFDSVQTVEA